MHLQTCPPCHGAEQAAASFSAVLCSQVLLSEFCFQAYHLAPVSLAQCPPPSSYKERLSVVPGIGKAFPPLPQVPSSPRLPFMALNQTAADLTNLFGMVHSTISTRTAQRAGLTHHERCGICTLNTDIWEIDLLMKESREQLLGRAGQVPPASHHTRGVGRGQCLIGRLSILLPLSRYQKDEFLMRKERAFPLPQHPLCGQG